jgi:hypothetical protein
MVAPDREDDPLALRSDTKSDSIDACFSDDEGNETDCSSIAGDDLDVRRDELDINSNLDKLESWRLTKFDLKTEVFTNITAPSLNNPNTRFP